MACPLATERVWVEQSQYNDAEKNYFERLSKLLKGSFNNNKTEIMSNVANENSSENPIDKSITKPKKSNNRSKKMSSESLSTDAVIQTASTSEETKEIEKDPKKLDDLSVISDKKDSSTTEELSKSKKARIRKKKNKNKSTTGNQQQEELNQINGVEEKEKNPLQKMDKKRNEKQQKGTGSSQCALVSEISKARQHIKNSLERMDDIAALVASPGGDVLERLAALEKQNAKLFELTEQLKKCFVQADNRINSLESRIGNLSVSGSAPIKKQAPPPKTDDDDDGVDLFASDSEEEDEAANKIREQRLAEYNAKKSKKPALIAKSSLVLDVKPWDDETDLKKMETEIRKIIADGLLWGASKFMPVAFGIQKLSISCVVEDDKVSIDWLTEEIEKLEDFVQSVDVAAFNKI